MRMEPGRACDESLRYRSSREGPHRLLCGEAASRPVPAGQGRRRGRGVAAVLLLAAVILALAGGGALASDTRAAEAGSTMSAGDGSPAALAEGGQDADTRPAERVYVGVYLHDISRFALSEGVFDVDAEVWAKWRGDFDPDTIRVANAAAVRRGDMVRERDGSWQGARWRMRGTLRGDFPVQDFPFDRQVIALQFELPTATAELVPDLAGSGIAERFSITDWDWEPAFRPVVETRRHASDLGMIATEGRPAEVRSVRFEVTLRRPIVPAILKLFLPLAIVGLIVFTSLFVPVESLQPRVTMCVTGLVACFAFQFSVADVMPTVAYLTLADALFLIVYVMSTTCVAVAVASLVLTRNGRERAANRLEWSMRALVPVLAVATVWLAIPRQEATPPAAPEAWPELEVRESTREVLRIGTTARLRLASSPVGVAAFGSLAPEMGGERVALWVERLPRVENDAIRFRADGGLEVTWRLREGARWSDGEAIVAEDLLLPLRARPDARIAEAEAVDERSVRLRWRERAVDALQAPEAWPHRVVGPIFEEGGEEALRNFLGEEMRPGLGPYRVVQADAERIVGERNPHWPLAPAAIARVEVLHFEEEEALVAAVERGEIDVVAPGVLGQERFGALAAERPAWAVEQTSANFVFLHADAAHPLWGRPGVQEALVRALDREGMVVEAFGASGRVAHAPVAGDEPAGLLRWSHDPEAARAAIVALGLEGREVVIAHGSAAPEALLARLRADLEAAGLVVRTEAVRSTWGMWRDGGFDGLVLHAMRADPEGDLRRWWGLPSERGRLVAEARTAAYTDEVADLIDREGRALYAERRAQLRDAVSVAWSRRLPAVPLAFPGEGMLIDPALQGGEHRPEAAFGHDLARWAFVE